MANKFEEFLVPEAQASETQLSKWERFAVPPPGSGAVPEPTTPKRSVLLEDEDLVVEYPATMSHDQVNDALQTDIYKRPRFNFYEDIVQPMATAGLPGVAARAGIESGFRDREKAITEPIKAATRATEGMLGGIGSLTRWLGENSIEEERRDGTPAEYAIGPKLKEWGVSMESYWRRQQEEGFEAADPEIFRGSFVSNPSWTRATAAVAAAIPSLATATALTFATKNPTAGAASLGLLEAGGEFSASRDAGNSLDKSNLIGTTNAVMLTILERVSLSRFLKGAGAAEGSIEEGLTEPAQQALTNVIAKIGYDETRDLMDGVVESFIGGAGSGGIMGGVTAGRAKKLDAIVAEAEQKGVAPKDIDILREETAKEIIKEAATVDEILDEVATDQAMKALVEEVGAEGQKTSQEAPAVREGEATPKDSPLVAPEAPEGTEEALSTEESELLAELGEESDLDTSFDFAAEDDKASPDPELEQAMRDAEKAIERFSAIKAFMDEVGKVRRFNDDYLKEELSGISRRFFTSNPSAETLDEVADRLGMDLNELIARLTEVSLNLKDDLKAFRQGRALLASEAKKQLRAQKAAAAKQAKEIDTLKAFLRSRKNIDFKKILHRETGFTKDNQAKISERAALRESLRVQARAALRASRETKKELQAVKKDASTLLEMLPSKSRGRFVRAVAEAENGNDLAKLLLRIEREAENVERRDAIRQIKKQLKRIEKSKSIAVDVMKRIKEAVEGIDFDKRSQKSLDKLKETAKFLNGAPEDTAMPQYVMDRLGILFKQPVSQISLDRLNGILEDITKMANLGKVKLRARQEILKLRKERMLRELAADTRHRLDSKGKLPKKIGIDYSFPQKFQNAYRAAQDYATRTGNAIKPMDHFFEALGPSYHRVFKQTIDAKYKAYTEENIPLMDETVELAESLKLTQSNLERIGAYAIDQQDGGRAKLLNTWSAEELDSLKLSPEEERFYKFMRGKLDEIRPRLEKMAEEVYNQPLGKVANYFPFITDFEQMTELEMMDRLSQLKEFQPGAKKNVETGMIKKREDKRGVQKVKIDAMAVFLHHMDNVLYAVNMAQDIKTLQELAKSEAYGETAGDIAQQLTVEWLDLLARKGGNSGEQVKGLLRAVEFFRKNTGVAMLALNPSSILIQATALGDAAGRIGNYAFKGAYDLKEKAWRDFVMDNSSELQTRVGDDQAFREFGAAWHEKLKSAAFQPTKFMDGQTASAVFIGAYQKFMEEKGRKINLNSADSEAVAYAERIVRESQSSSQFKDMPLFISKGVGVGKSRVTAKLLTQFQTPLFYRYANLTTLAPRAWADGKKAEAVGIITSQLITTAAEMVVRNGTRATLALIGMAILGMDPEDEEAKSAWQWLGDYATTVAGNVPFISNGVSLFAYRQAPAPTPAAIGEMWRSIDYAIRAKKDDTRSKWVIISALQAAGVGTGLPLSFKVARGLRSGKKGDSGGFG